MDMLQIAAFALIAGTLATLVRPLRPPLGLLLSLATGAIVFGLILTRLGSVVQVLANLSQRASLDGFYFGTLLRIVGVAYVAEFVGEVLRDADEQAIASKVELAGKVIILALAVPILLAILDVIAELLA